MYISTPSKTKNIVQSNDFSFRKKYGQNFLVDTSIIDKIVEGAGVCKDDIVLEIGPGVGSLTEKLAIAAKEVTAIEIDRKLIPILNKTLQAYDNINIVHGDMLKTSVEELFADKESGTKIKVVANLPYYITTTIIMSLLENTKSINSITVMVQKEVAERIHAKPSTKEYGSLTIACQYYAEPTIITYVPPTCFMPKPDVESCVIRLDVRQKPIVEINDQKLFFELVRASFAQRRKTMLNSVSSCTNFTKQEVADALVACGLSVDIRGEALSIEQFGMVANRLIAKDFA